MAKLYFRYSAMGAGKSIDLLKVAYNYEERGMHIMLLTSALDIRKQGQIYTRIGLSRNAELYSEETNLVELVDNVIKKVSSLACILIDEAQFLKKEQVYQLVKVVDDYHIPVICYGLRSDYTGEPFEGSIYLMTLADKIEEVKTICHCGSKAIMNALVENDKMLLHGDQIVIDDESNNQTRKFVSLCRHHWFTRKVSSSD